MKRTPLLALVATLFLAAFLGFGRWRTEFYGGDPSGYYFHLTSALLYHDVGDYSKSIAAWHPYRPGEADPREDKYGFRPSPTGKTVDKYPLGVPLLQAPFFVAGHVAARISGGVWATDGWSEPYMFLVGLSALFWVLVGFWFLEKLLARHFARRVVTAVILTLAFATNLPYFSVWNNGMAHGYLFMLFAALLFFSQKFWDAPTPRRAFAVGATVGFIAISRQTEVICALIPLFWGISTWRDLPARAQFFGKNWRLVGSAALGFALLLAPQLAYWKFVSGQWLFRSYVGESFDWRHPHLFGGWFDFSNGWLIWTPVMALSLLGIFGLNRWGRAARWPLAAFLPLHLYIIYSWWCWNYINGFGSRPMVETYPLLAFPLGAFFAWAFSRKFGRWPRTLGTALAFFAGLNIFQLIQTHRGTIFTEWMNPAWYAASFGKLDSDRAAQIACDSREWQPDPASLKLAKTLILNEFEDSTDENFSRQFRASGQFGYRVWDEFTSDIPFPSQDFHPNQYLKISVKAFVPAAEREAERQRQPRLVVEFQGPDGQIFRYRSLAIPAQIGNPTGSIWSGGEPDQWGEASFFVHVPSTYAPGCRAKAYIFNPNKRRFFVDDFSVELWGE